jgi:hypothetical protein
VKRASPPSLLSHKKLQHQKSATILEPSEDATLSQKTRKLEKLPRNMSIRSFVRNKKSKSPIIPNEKRFSQFLKQSAREKIVGENFSFSYYRHSTPSIMVKNHK